MKLSDVMSAADLAIYAEVGLVLFMLVFVAVAVRVLLPSKDRDYERAGQIPFSDEPTHSPNAEDAR